MKNRNQEQFDLFANYFERIRDPEVMIESSWSYSKPLAYFTNSKTSVSRLDQQTVY
jgi:hypothetical protein